MKIDVVDFRSSLADKMLCYVLVNDDDELAVVDDVVVYVMIVTCYVGKGKTCIELKR